MVKIVDREEILTVAISILLVITLPLITRLRDPLFLAYIFASVWFVYAALKFEIVFLIRPGLKIKVNRQKATMVKYELRDRNRFL